MFKFRYFSFPLPHYALFLFIGQHRRHPLHRRSQGWLLIMSCVQTLTTQQVLLWPFHIFKITFSHKLNWAVLLTLCPFYCSSHKFGKLCFTRIMQLSYISSYFKKYPFICNGNNRIKVGLLTNSASGESPRFRLM